MDHRVSLSLFERLWLFELLSINQFAGPTTDDPDNDDQPTTPDVDKGNAKIRYESCTVPRRKIRHSHDIDNPTDSGQLSDRLGES